ncbi:MAG: ABC transporter permease subunit [Actinobacteria bacterium]|nr:ABC transporter permease subunit [Actinomycetota bacterium]
MASDVSTETRGRLVSPAGARRRFSLPLGADILTAAVVFLILYLIVRIGTSSDVPLPPPNNEIDLNPWLLPGYSLASLLRMFIGLALSYVFALVFGYWAARNAKAGSILVPTLDILQSVPVLGFLSITVTGFLALFPGSQLGLECAAIFAIFTAQAWNLAFSMYHSSLTLPKEFDEMSRLFRLTAWMRFWRIEVPNAAIGLVWNGMMSMGGAWFFLTASETISVAGNDYALPGIGSYAGQALKQGDVGDILWAIAAMIILIVAVNYLFWRPLVAWAERFRNEQSAPEATPTSSVLNVLHTARWPRRVGAMRRAGADRLGRGMRFLGSDARPIRSGTSTGRRVWDFVFWLIVATILVWGIWSLLDYVMDGQGPGVFLEPFGLAVFTMLRVFAVLVLSTVIWVPIGVKIGMNPKLSRIAQPLVQIFASFPANLLFPLVTSFLVWSGISLNIGGIFLMMLGAQWYILFNVIAAAQGIPSDLREAMADMRVGSWLWWKRFALPAVYPGYVTGGITASGGAWNASIVAEVVSFGSTTLTAAGIGAYISLATAAGNQREVLLGVIVMSIFVIAMNRLIWKRFYRLAEERYSID